MLIIFQKWVEAKALPTNDARVVVKFLKSPFARFGTPRAIISNRGTYFCNDKFARVMSKYGVTHRLSTVNHPSIVVVKWIRVSNRQFEIRILERTVGENRASWSDRLDGRSMGHFVICLIRHQLVATPYMGSNSRAISASCNLMKLNVLVDQGLQEFFEFIRERTKIIHDSKIKNRFSNMLVDQVLLFNSRLSYSRESLKPDGPALSP
ncbi:reverse transcriptase domain-containing protein [Tanacetum coccineum]|uniref:Reverse transcriptase domain-containing protein n=1 Tax=Tanacetum coccineum TaxID=301880 RepID=A0ABQ5G3I0_9ASTR